MTRAAKPAAALAALHTWTAEPPDQEIAKALERLARTEDVVQVAVLPDVHLAKEVCVGVALATRSLLFPQAVGGDIGCGMAALRFNSDGGLLAERQRAARLMAELAAMIPITRHRKGDEQRAADGAARNSTVPDGQILSHPALERRWTREGRQQLGTLGRGNHFVEFQEDEAGALWLMVHSGSRAMGQAIQAHHMTNTAQASTGLGFLRAEAPEGEAYLNDVNWALAYAAANRLAMVNAVAEIMEAAFGVAAERASFIACHHNFVQREEIGGRELWIHRKGVISALQGEPGLVPGSMGAPSFHVEGRGCETSLCSSSHGAGRAMSRGEARRRISVKALERQMGEVWFDHRRAARLVDEAPGAYKNVSAVMRAQRDLTRIRRKLRPLLSFKGG
jgi:tRNA-splicing ligase RtcB